MIKRILKLMAAVLVFVLCMKINVSAANTEYVRDEYGVLSASEVQELNELAARVSDAHNAGVYVRVMNNMGSYFTIEDYSEAVWKEEEMGFGDTDDGIMLLLDMDTRSFDIFVRHGGLTEQAFGTYAREQMADVVVNDYLRYDEYAEAFSNFIAIADADYAYAEAGTPISEDFDPARDEREQREREAREAAERTAKTGATVGIPPIAALLACLGMKSRNKTTEIKKEADNYIPEGGMRLTNRSDRFLYRTESRTRIQKDDDSRSSGGSSFSSSSSSFGSHTSGHF